MKRRGWQVKIAVVLVFVLVSWVIYVSSKQIERNRRIQEEVSALEMEAQKIQSENETLSEKIGYFSSVDFREQEAKRRLGLKKPEETVLGVSINPHSADGKLENLSEERVEAMSQDEGADLMQFEKWWRLFF